ncbi:tetratricopeptide repeat-containing sulfotransferase family protein [Alteriqipengyuania lutimaris]|uniref:tetratricopeptide repeat-containing sulfotransferase family protein n=1 Tax=Alteriqipengyuania lutimaris TaxID=1538146 RepID=UPI0015F147ED|nr:sulfotransferase [Alteriqipengyuania lutimaris]MBB3033861.1 hypothetical protein [Alteriqipengyuania lutimaris]
MLAQIALEHENFAGADQLARLIRASGHREAWLDLIDARLALSRQDGATAREAITRAAVAGTRDPHLAAQIGVVLARTGLHAEAVRFSGQAVEGEPRNPGYRYNHAIELQFNGDLDAARAEFEALVELAPDHAQGWLALVGLSDDPPVAWREALAALFARSDETEMRLVCGHALARWHEAHVEWETSFEWLERAKDRKAREVAHDRAEAEGLFSAAAAGAEGAFPAIAKRPVARPIFIVGLPRSGTTLIERIVAAHPQVRSLGELSEFGIALKRHLDTPGRHVLDEALLKAASDTDDLAPVGREYLRIVAGLAGDAAVFTDKMPFNIFYAPAILRALPEARIVCLRRSPFDVLFANFRQLFATGFSYYSYAYDFVDTAHFVARFESLCDRFAATLPADRFMVQRYEDLVIDQEAQTRKLIAFCGLEWDDACLSPQSNRQAVATASAVQVRAPVHSGSIDRWKRYGAAADRAVEELAQFGIAPSSG